MKKRVLALMMSLILAVGLLAGCGGSSSESSEAAATEAGSTAAETAFSVLSALNLWQQV